MDRIGLQIDVIPSSAGIGRQRINVGISVHTQGGTVRIVRLIENALVTVPDGELGNEIHYAIEMTDLVYQMLTQVYASTRSRPSFTEVNARPSDTSTN